MNVLLPVNGCRLFKARLTKTGIPEHSIMENFEQLRFQGNLVTSVC